MFEKPKVAFYWCSSCGGCEESIVDLAEDLLDVVGAIEIILWPVAMDFKNGILKGCPIPPSWRPWSMAVSEHQNRKKWPGCSSQEQDPRCLRILCSIGRHPQSGKSIWEGTNSGVRVSTIPFCGERIQGDSPMGN